MLTYGGMAKQPVTVPVVILNLLNCIYGISVYTMILFSGLSLLFLCLGFSHLQGRKSTRILGHSVEKRP